MNFRILHTIFLCGILLPFFSACSTIVNSHTQKEDMVKAYLAGNHKNVSKELSGKLADSWSSVVGTGDEIMWRLEAGSFYFTQGRYKESFTEFGKADSLIDDYDRRAVVNLRQAAAEGTMLMINPNVLPYHAFCRDRILSPVYKALDCLGMNDEPGFRVELFRLREIQDKVIAEYSKYFKEEKAVLEDEKKKNQSAAANTDIGKVLEDLQNRNISAALEQTKNVANKGYGNFLNPFTVFMSGYGYLRDADYQNAVVDFERLYKAMPEHPLVRKYYVSVLRLAGHHVPEKLKNVSGFDFPTDRNNILVIFANGRSAALRQQSLYLPVYYAHYITMAAVAWQLCEYYEAPFVTLNVLAGKKTYLTSPVADMDGILSQEYWDRFPGMLTRILLSTAAKEISSYIAIEAARQGSSGAGLAVAIGTAGYKALFNTADTRSWEMIPKEFQVVQLPVPADHAVTLSLPGLPPHKITLSKNARSAIVFVNAPSKASAAVTYHLFELYSK